jgi:2-keto-4-pentenoate hydratase/2-oxohepta-3-ene-1,7-dioic acid hydratase in catechol pathway
VPEVRLATTLEGRPVAAVGDAVVDLRVALDAPTIDIVGVIAAFDELRPRIEAAAETAPGGFDDLALGPPLVPPSIYCIGLNYRAHSAEWSGSDAPLPIAPIVFMKPATTLTGPGTTVEVASALGGELDYEGELGVVIGRRCRDVARGDAGSVIAGYTIVNDLSARDLQRRHQQWILGKSLDGFCPVGPWIAVSNDAHPDLEIETIVDGEQRQHARTSQLIFDIGVLIETLSAGRTLLPGDLIATGTPSGVGMASDPPRWLTDGSEVTVRIEGLGSLTNRIRIT